jgi:ankyrin repeat protein
MDSKKDDPKQAAGSDDDEEESEEEVPQEVIDQGLLDACRENNMEEAMTYLEKANPLYTKDGWNALLWAANNGNDQLIRLLHKRGATSMYLRNGQ